MTFAVPDFLILSFRILNGSKVGVVGSMNELRIFLTLFWGR